MEYQLNLPRALFDPSLLTKAYPHLFRLLRHSNLPCFPDDQVIRCLQSSLNQAGQL